MKRESAICHFYNYFYRNDRGRLLDIISEFSLDHLVVTFLNLSLLGFLISAGTILYILVPINDHCLWQMKNLFLGTITLLG